MRHDAQKASGAEAATGTEPIAIVGMSGVFPDARNVDEFWRNLRDGRDSVGEVPRDRGWQIEDYFDPKPQTRGKTYVKRGAFIQGIDLFDPFFFEIAPSSAVLMDPSARLFLQEAWRAIEDAGYSSASLSGTRCGMYFCAKGDYPNLLQRFEDTYLASTDTYAPARLAYHLNLIGPAVSLDTACSSTLTAVAQACDALVLGNCDMAIVGGGGLNATPNALVTSSQLLLFSPTGRCSTFDARADGTILGEAVGALVLKRLERALSDGDHIHGVIRGWGTNQDGRTNGQTAPSAKSQVRLQTEIYKKFAIDPNDITMVEAHGTGTKLGDPIEVQALTESFRRFTDAKGYCALGSLKTNIGHAFFGAGVTSVVKVLLALRHRMIPPTLNFDTINPAIKIAESPFYVNTALRPWQPAEGRPRMAAVNAFGATGTNAHLVIEEFVEDETARIAMPSLRVHEPCAIVVSAKTENRLLARVEELVAFLKQAREVSLADLAYTLQVGRDAMGERLGLVTAGLDDLEDRLAAFLETQDAAAARVHRGRLAGGAIARMETAAALRDEVADVLKRGDREALVKLWTGGAVVEWTQMHGEGLRDLRRISAPTYPFAGERYWADQSLSDSHGNGGRHAGKLHPLLHENVSSVNELCFRSTFNGEEFFLRDHVIRDRKLLPGVAYLEIARAAASLASDTDMTGRTMRLKKVVWIQPFVYGPDNMSLRIALGPAQGAGDDGSPAAFEFEIYGGEGDLVTRHCQGEVHFDKAEAPPRLDLAALRKACTSAEIAGARLYPFLAASGFQLGPGHQGVERLFAGDGQALGRLVLPRSVSKGFEMHPSLMDSALQTASGLLFGQDAASRAGAVPLPFALESLELFAPCPDTLWAWVRYAEGSSPADKVTRTDIDLCDDKGQVCVRMRGLTSRDMRKDAAPAAARGEAQTTLLRPVWKEEAGAMSGAAGEGERYVVYCANESAIGGADLVEAQDGVTGVIRIAAQAGADAAQNYTDAAACLLDVVRSAMQRQSERGTPTLLQLAVHPSAADSHLGGLAALLRSAHQENSQLIGQAIVFEDDPGAHAISECLDAEAARPMDAQVRYARGKRFVLRHEELSDAAPKPDAPWRKGGVYLIAGGAGGLGLIFAREIAASVADARIVLTGRGQLGDAREAALADLRAMGCTVEYHRLDIADGAAVAAMVDKLYRDHGGIAGVIHCAGVLRDNYIPRKSADELRAVLAPKVAGLVNLDRAIGTRPLELFVGFSSLAGAWGNAGQSDYASANAFMDAYLSARAGRVAAGRAQGRSLAIDWPLWKDGGMRVDAAYESLMANTSGFVPLPTAAGVAAFHRAWSEGDAQMLVVHADRAVWQKSLAQRAKVEAHRARSASEAPDAGTEALKTEIVSLIRSLIADLIRADVSQINPAAEMSEFGLDSISFTKLTNTLHDDYHVSLSPTIFFEYSTIDEFAKLLAEVYGDDLRPRLGVVDASAPKAVPAPLEEAPAADASRADASRADAAQVDGHLSRPRLRGAWRATGARTEKPADAQGDRGRIAVIGMSAQFPMARDYRQFWNNLASGRDCIVEIPKDRWDWQKIYGDPRNDAEVTNIKWGGFIDGIGDWDPAFFSISPREAELIDPQKRLLMTYVWKAIEDAGYAPSSLWGSNTALYIGTADSGYASLYAQAGLKNDGSGTPASMGPNRMSYFLNLHGASEPVETACSSSLIAINRAVRALRDGTCDLAIAGGIQLIPTPAKHISFSQAGILCEDGRCKTFSSKANGYVRSEGIGMLVLKRLSDAERDGDSILGVVLGIAENHGGRANSLTSPNPRAQAVLLQAAYRDAGIDPRTVGYIEAHGTGTMLGDPIEINGLKSAFKQLYADTEATKVVERKPGETHCALGSVKTNIGHAELAAGVAGVIKVLLQMRHGTLVESLHCDELNPHIDFSDSPFEVVREKREWRRVTDAEGRTVPRRAGISSFGVGGVNAHVVLEEYA